MMLSAIGLLHWANGFFTTEGGIEFPLLMAVTAAAVAIAGPYSLDAALDLPVTGALWSGGAIVAGVLAPVVTLVVRQVESRQRGTTRARTA